MTVSSAYEMSSFLASILLGLICGVVYDFAKSLRLKGMAADIVMWLFITLWSVWGWNELLGGALRWYILTGAVLSFVLYRFTASALVFFIFSTSVKKIYCFFNIILKILLTARDFLGKIVGIYRAKSINNKEVTVNEEA